MSDKDDVPPAEEEDQVSIFRRLRDIIPFGRAPDSTEALEHEIQELLEEGEEHGLISSLEERMINAIFGFRDTLAAEIMTPAAEIISFEISTPIPYIIEVIIEEGFTRIPIYKENSDRIIGILHAKDLLRICVRGSEYDGNLERYLNNADFVSEDKPIGELLKEFQKNKTHMAIVMDEFGAVRGLITLEDILEEIVGEIDDEYDVDDDDFEKIDEKTSLVRGKVDIEDVEDRLNIELPKGPYESIGGLIIHSLGRLPEDGESVRIGDIELIVYSAGKRKVKKVKVVYPQIEESA